MSSVVERLDAVEVERRRLAAEAASLLREVEADGLHGDEGFTSVRSWLRHRYRLSESETTGRMREATALSIAEVAGAFASGEVSGCAVRELGRAASNPRCGDGLVEVVGPLLDAARKLRHVDLRMLVRQWERLADADGVTPEPEVLHERRTLRLRQDFDGAFHLSGRFGNTQGAVIEELLDRFAASELAADLAAARADDTVPSLARTTGQRYADALVVGLTAGAAAPSGAAPPEPLVQIVVDQETFEHHAVDQWADEEPEPIDPMTFADRVSRTRHGSWVDPRTIPAAALVGHVRRVVLDGAGVTIDLGRRRRLFTGTAREATRAARQRCSAPGCDVPAHRCEVDHVEPWAAGGRTDQHNARLLCGRHHRERAGPRAPPAVAAV